MITKLQKWEMQARQPGGFLFPHRTSKGPGSWERGTRILGRPQPRLVQREASWDLYTAEKTVCRKMLSQSRNRWQPEVEEWLSSEHLFSFLCVLFIYLFLHMHLLAAGSRCISSLLLANHISSRVMGFAKKLRLLSIQGLSNNNNFMHNLSLENVLTISWCYSKSIDEARGMFRYSRLKVQPSSRLSRHHIF